MKRAFVGMVVGMALTAGFAPAAHAQSGFGIKGGFTFGNVSNAGALPGNLHSRSGYALGVAYEAGSPVGIGLEALYAQTGVSGGSIGQARSLNYLDVPLYVRIGVPAGSVMPFAYAGPQAEFQLQCRAGGAPCPNTVGPKTAYGAVIGGGLRLPGGLTVEGRYTYGLTDLKLSTISTATSYQSRAFMILLGFGF